MEEYCRVVKLDLNCFWPGGNKRVGHTLFYLNVIYLPLISICVPLSVISCSSVYVYMFVFCFVVTPSWEFVSPWVFFFFLHIYLIYAVFIKLVLHYVWQLFCPFYSHFSCMSVGVLYDCVLASMDKKYFVILPDFSLHKKNKFFCVKIIVLFVFMIFVSIIPLVFFCLPFPHIYQPVYIKKSPFWFFIIPPVSSHILFLLSSVVPLPLS